jgi:hypothetical protein
MVQSPAAQLADNDPSRKENPMKKLMTALALAAAVAALPAHAADEKKPTPQQERMAHCNKEAADKKGDERKAFMKTCLSTKKTSQQDKMRACNKEAEGKTGDERKKFMSECLKA